jgi:hypothetical protein
MRTIPLLAVLIALSPIACRCGKAPEATTTAPPPAPPPPGDPSRPAKEGEALVSAEPVEKGTCTAKKPAPLAKDAAGPLEKVGQLPNERVGTVAVTQGNDVWLLGGQTKDAQRTTRITAAKLGPDGVPGPWREAGQLPAKRPNAGVVLHGGVLHIFGGETGDGASPAGPAPEPARSGWKLAGRLEATGRP